MTEQTLLQNWNNMNKNRFHSDANKEFRYPSADLLLKHVGDLSDMILQHMTKQVPRLETLERYYLGQNDTIMSAHRRKEDHLADNRAAHAVAEYISQFVQGYMIGVPLKTVYEGEEREKEFLKNTNRNNDADEHNSDLILDLSIYGRAYEILYRNKEDENRFAISDVMNTFVIYDDTVERQPIAAVRYTKNFSDERVYTVYLYTDNKVITYQSEDKFSGELMMIKEEDHYFDGVPIIEYKNNKFRTGDFEKVLSGIDLYDAAQSDTANYMQDLNDAMLKITGDVEIDVEKAKDMKQHNILLLKPSYSAEGSANAVDANYIYKQYDVAGTEQYKTRIFNDILMVASVPNLLDNNFSGNQSGEALKMKLFGLSQKRAIKERLFKKSLRDRYRLIANIARLNKEADLDVNSIIITFTENLPRAITEELKTFASLGGKLSQETLISLLVSGVENPAEEIKKIEAEDPRSDGTYDFMKPEGEE
ncbi:phage portal protein [Shouchella lonarensis]|uniref:Phage portal protein, SPP1 family n=1 Tax=Shouchella lonarensis TaxID=1464122 RepID=A0A1G6HSU9_9BACI|nr:phage portal protein [Shouchella lonarensis]SDB96566.1 phage portal protein, SPP1 family [Shouchella lonarensis]